MDEFSIGQVARRAGLRTSAIRYYEGAGLLPRPRRSSGRRRYDAAIVDRLALIQFAREAGFTIGEIRTLFEGFEADTPMSLRWQALARRKLTEVDAMMERAERMRTLLGHALACGCLRVEDCARLLKPADSSESAEGFQVHTDPAGYSL